MFLSKFFGFGGSRRHGVRPRRPAATFRPGLESLEQRETPSSTLSLASASAAMADVGHVSAARVTVNPIVIDILSPRGIVHESSL
jgi:hypothetical protein